MELISGKMTSKGQITIPKEVREQFNVKEGDQFQVIINNDSINLKPIKKKKLSEIMGKIKIEEPIDIEKMREVAQKDFAEKFYREDILGDNE